MGKGRLSEARPHWQRHTSRTECLEDHQIVLRVRHHDHVCEVLRRGPHHRRATDIDVVGGRRNIGAHRVSKRRWRQLIGANCGDERVEVARNQINRSDVMRRQVCHIAGVVAPCQDPPMNRRVQRLHSPTENLRRTRHVRNLAHRDPGRSDHGVRLSGRNEVPPKIVQALRELDDADFVPNAQQCPHRFAPIPDDCGAYTTAPRRGYPPPASSSPRHYRI